MWNRLSQREQAVIHDGEVCPLVENICTAHKNRGTPFALIFQDTSSDFLRHSVFLMNSWRKVFTNLIPPWIDFSCSFVNLSGPLFEVTSRQILVSLRKSNSYMMDMMTLLTSRPFSSLCVIRSRVTELTEV